MSKHIDPVLLRTLHRILRQQTDLNDRLRRGPARVNVAKQAEAAFQAALDEGKQLLKETRMNADRKQLQLDQREAKIEEIKNKRNACESNREYQLLNDQIAADEQANLVQSDEILELLEKVDVVQSQAAQAEANLQKGQAETQRLQAAVDEELATLNKDLDLVNQELAQTESQLPSDIRAEYQRLMVSLGEDVLAPVDDNSCGHCCTTLTTQVISELMMGQAVFCKSCGSLLYLGENAAV
ncbi:MAG: zinc ribbon domain-containing protein [Pirellulaceae bacterium]